MTAYKKMQELEASVDDIRQAPTDNGTLELIVARPASGERIVQQEGRLTFHDGLEGDNWRFRMVGNAADIEPETDNQLSIMNIRVVRLLDPDPQRWPLAGDQLYVDLDLSDENLPPGTRLQIGDAVVEVSALPHTGCKAFSQRFGADAMKFVNSETGSQLHMRGIMSKVITEGSIRPGDIVAKL